MAGSSSRNTQQQQATNNMYSSFLVRRATDLYSPLLFTAAAEDDGDDNEAVVDEESAAAAAPPPNSAAQQKASPPASCTKYLKLRRTTIHVLNIVAAVVHGVLFITLYFLALGKNKQVWSLKQDRTQVLPESIGSRSPFVQVSDATCSKPAKANLLGFGGSSEIGQLQIWTYPQVNNTGLLQE